MTDIVPAVDRAAKLMNYVAAHPRQAFTVSELASAIDINKGTCFATLKTLTGAGLLTREDHRKTYRLGPRLVSLAAATADYHEGFRTARTAMFGLARDLGCYALVATREADSMIVLDRAGAHALPSRPGLREGEVTPLKPPFGTIFYAWEPPERAEDWFRRMAPEATASELVVYRQMLSSVRARGYSVGGDVESEVDALNVLTHLRRAAGDAPAEVLQEIKRWLWSNDLRRTVNGDPDAPADYVIAPVFDASGAVVLCITLYGRPGQITIGNVDTFARPLLAAARDVTALTGGITPGSSLVPS